MKPLFSQAGFRGLFAKVLPRQGVDDQGHPDTT
jgi:hypothetical protein